MDKFSRSFLVPNQRSSGMVLEPHATRHTSLFTGHHSVLILLLLYVYQQGALNTQAMGGC